MVCGTLVNVAGTVGISVDGVELGVAVKVTVAVEVAVAVDVTEAVVVMVTVPSVGVTEAVGDGVEVLEGRGLLVVVVVRLGVQEGSGLG